MPIKWVTPPREPAKKVIGNKNCGEIEMEVFGGMTTDEADTVQEITVSMDTPYLRAAILANIMASREKIKTPKGSDRQLTNVEAYQIIADDLNGKEHSEKQAKEIALKYAKEISEVSKYNRSYRSVTKKATVTALIKHRVADDHTYEDTLKLPIQLVDLIC